MASVLTINDRPVFRRGLTKEQAKLVSQYMVREYSQTDPQPRIVQVWDYLVEVPGRDGQPASAGTAGCRPRRERHSVVDRAG